MKTLIRNDLANDVNVNNAFDLIKTEIGLSEIVTVKSENKTTYCQSKAEINYALNQRMEKTKNENPSQFQSIMFNYFPNVVGSKFFTNINYIVQKTDDGKIKVSFQ